MIRVKLVVSVFVFLAQQSIAQLKPVAIDQFFMEPNRPATLQWAIQPTAPSTPLDYAITDYTGKTVAKSRTTQVHDSRIDLPLSLHQGYYEIEFTGTHERFGLCALPRPGKPDPFFCMDSALGWLERRSEMREALAGILHRIGVTVSRERMSWDGLQPGPREWNWQTTDRYEDLRKSYARHDVKVLEMSHAAPGWMGAHEGNPYPTDLAATALAWKQIGSRWGRYWSGLEIWNEPDIFFGGNLPGDQYAALAKAVAFGLSDAPQTIPLVGGVFTDGCPDAFREACARNGLLEQLDVVSFHTYKHADTLQNMVQTYRDWLREYGKESMPLWITESGRPWKRGTGRPTAEQDALSALDIIMKAIEARACGIAAYYAFVSVYYEEKEQNFGMMGKEVTPLRSMTAYAQAMNALSGKHYQGDLKSGDSAVQRARVFGDDTQSVIVLYTGRVDPKAVVHLAFPIDRVEGIDGRALKVDSARDIPVPDGLAYLWVQSSRIRPLLQTDTVAAHLTAISMQPAPRRPRPSPIILQHLYSPQEETGTNSGYVISPEEAAHFQIHVRVHNLGQEAQRIDLHLDEQAGANDDDRTTVDLAPLTYKDVKWDVDLRKRLDVHQKCSIVVKATGKAPLSIAPLVINAMVASPKPTTKP